MTHPLHSVRSRALRVLVLAAGLLPLVLLSGALAGCDRGASTSASAAARTGGGPGLVYAGANAPRPYFHDFGDRLWGERIEHTFVLENREGRAIVLQDLMPDCGCTLPRATVVMPDGTRVDGPVETRAMNFSVPDGAQLEVRIALDTTRVERPNQHKLSQVRLRCDSDATPYLTFELHVLVKRALRSVPAEAVLKDVPQSAGKSVRLDVSTEIAGDGTRVRGVEAVEGPFQAEVTEAQVAGENVWVVVVRVDPGAVLGPHAGKIVFGTTNSDGTGVGQPFEVHVRAQVVEDVILDPRMLTIPRESGTAATVNLIALVPGAQVLVRRVRLDGGGTEALRADFAAEAPDDQGRASRWRITVSALSTLPAGALSGRMIVDLDDPALPSVEVPYAVAAR